MTQPIRIRARVQGDLTEVRILMQHPMETGLRSDDSGNPVPAHFITEVTVNLGERVVFAARMSFAVARDPLLAFRFTGAQRGQRLRVAWTDNRGESRVDEATLI